MTEAVFNMITIYYNRYRFNYKLIIMLSNDNQCNAKNNIYIIKRKSLTFVFMRFKSSGAIYTV